MSAPKSPRKGSLQFWPRKRASKLLPSVNWDVINSGKNLKGFICYKVGMASAFVKDNTEHSMTKGKKIAVPVTIMECPKMKILSVRFYKNGQVANEILAENPDKELTSVIKLPKSKKGKIDDVKSDSYDDIRIIAYSEVKKTNIKKTPDIIEIGLSGSLDEKLNYVKDKLNKEISISEIFEKGQLADARGLTKGKGLSGPVKRFGITLKQHKSEKGRRRPGSLGPWHPARVIFRVPMAGQLGMFTRVVYNNKIIQIGKPEEMNLKNRTNYGDVKTDYMIIRGSIQGPHKRQIPLTYPLRETRKQIKKHFEFLELR